MNSNNALNALLSGDVRQWDEERAYKETDPSRLSVTILADGNISGRNFDGYRFHFVHFHRMDMSKASFKGAVFYGASFNACNLIGADFSSADFREAQLSDVKCDKETLFCGIIADDSARRIGGTTFKGIFEEADFQNANFRGADLTGCSFLNAHVQGVSFRRATLSRTSWQGTAVDRHTDFDLANFDEHPVTRDKSHLVSYSWFGRKFLFNWKMTRFIGSLPIFGFSWALLIGSLFLINFIGYLNETRPIIFEGLNYIPLPERVVWTMLSALLLAIGSTVYKLFCPEQVKEFSEAQWVYEHGHNRLEYISQSLQKIYPQAIATITLLVGGVIGLLLIGNNVWAALHHLLNSTLILPT